MIDDDEIRREVELERRVDKLEQEISKLREMLIEHKKKGHGVWRC